MISLNPQYITDTNGNKVSVVLSLKEFQFILEELEELEDIKLYDEGKSNGDQSIPIDEAFKKIEAKRKQKN